jgi:ABC-2 type transport system ATP-binding protein
MKAIAGVLAHDSGRVEVFGTELCDEASADSVKGRLGFMPQGLGLSLYPELSVMENIDFFAELRGVTGPTLAARKERLLGLTRLAAFGDRLMKHLSGGMKQKLALACTLVHEPDLVILDEPTTGVDPLSRRDFWSILAELVSRRRLSVLISTAYLDEAHRCDRVALLQEGKLLARGAPEELRREVWQRMETTRTTTFDTFRLEEVYLALVGARVSAAPAFEVAANSPQQPSRKVAKGAPEAGAPEAEVAIEALDLCRDFESFRAVDRVNFRVRFGEIFGLLGANGAGKTTVIKMLTGILAPSAGEGRIVSMDMRRPGPALRRRIGYMSQSFSLYTDLTVLENIRLYAGVYGLSRSEMRRQTEWIIALGGLEGHANEIAGRLPVGMRQRLALGCALVHRPRVLFLDEPTSGVDPVGRIRFWDILLELARSDAVSILITTHALAEAERCDRVALMHAGQVIADAAPGALERQVAAEVGHVIEIDAEPLPQALAVLRAAGHPEAAAFGRQLHFFSHDPELELQSLGRSLERAGARLLANAERPLRLEDVFVHYIGALERGREQRS